MTSTDNEVEESAAIVPDFGDDDTDRKICFICSKGTLDMAYPALIMANGAVGEGVETHIFFTFWGMDMITKKTMHDLKFTILGNPATHMPQGLGGIPGMTSMSTKMMKKQIAEQDVPEVPEFLELLHDSGVQMWACKMSVDMMKLSKDDLSDIVEDIINVSDFIELSDGAQVIFV
jgi:peroxiredoxin family protein